MAKTIPQIKEVSTLSVHHTILAVDDDSNSCSISLHREDERYWRIRQDMGSALTIYNYSVRGYLKLLQKARNTSLQSSRLKHPKKLNTELRTHKREQDIFTIDILVSQAIPKLYDEDDYVFFELSIHSFDGGWIMGDKSNFTYIPEYMVESYIALLKVANKVIKAENNLAK
jgi:hypothetical protein